MAKEKRLVTARAPAFRSSSEVMALLRVPKHVLAFWERRFPLLKPLIGSQGRRMWAPNDVELLQGIRHHLYEDGLTIRGVQKIIRDHGVEVVRATGRGESGEPMQKMHQLALPAAADCLPVEKRRALIAALSCPEACRALAQTSVGLGF